MRDKRYRQELGVTIPQDLTPQNWTIYTICAPDSVEWRMAVYAAVRLLSRGRYWMRDDRATSIKQAQEIGRKIEMSFSACNFDEVLVKFDELNTGIQSAVAQIAAAIAAKDFCCDTPSYYAPPPSVVTNQGDPPANYGENTTADWEEYNAYICGVAKQWVQGLIVAMSNFADVIDTGSIVIGGVALVLSMLAAPAVGLLIAVSYGTAAEIFTALLNFSGTETVDDVATFLIAQENEIARAIVCAGSPEAAALAVRQLLSNNLTPLEYTAVKYFDIEGDMARIYAGEDKNGVALNLSPSSTCACSGSPAPAGFEFVPATILDVPSYRINVGGSNPAHVLEGGGASVLFSFDGDVDGSVDMNIKLAPPPDSLDGQYVGIGWNTDAVTNAKPYTQRILTSTEPFAIDLYDIGEVIDAPYNRRILVKANMSSGAFPSSWGSDTTVTARDGTQFFLGGCVPDKDSMRIGGHAAAAGRVELRMRDIFWIKSLGEAC